MTSIEETRLQTLRSIDKYDRVGLSGVFDLLTTGRQDSSGVTVPGCGLSNGQALVLCSLVAEGHPLQQRLRLMSALEEHELEDGTTVFDRLLAMSVNADQTWNNGGRPENIAWALDDICEMLRRRTV